VAQFDLIVTGANGQIGSSIVNYFSSQGFRVGSLDLSLGHDLLNEVFVNEWFKNNAAESLINCFALNDHVTSGSHGGKFVDIPLADFEKMLQVNVLALFSVCRAFVKNNSSGSVVNFSSIYSKVSPRPEFYGGGEKNIAYGVSKAAVNQLTRHLAVHTAPSFRFNSIILGGVENNQNSTFIKDYSDNTPLGRMAHVSDVNSAIEFLISKDSSYVTGAEIVIDGGWLTI
jgi:NAD(P)-dependent dehydrogenase (short-subunit alcohol dehydrogenase family)